jgi:hypothetical protein
MIDGRPYLGRGVHPGRTSYGIYLDEMDDDYLTGMITQADPASYPACMYSSGP